MEIVIYCAKTLTNPNILMECHVFLDMPLSSFYPAPTNDKINSAEVFDFTDLQ